MEKRNFFGAIAKALIIYLMSILLLAVIWQLLVVINNGIQNQGLTNFNKEFDRIIWYLDYPTNYLSNLSNQFVEVKYNVILDFLRLIHATQQNLVSILQAIILILLYLVLYILINKNKSGKLVVITVLYISALFLFTELNIVYMIIFILGALRKAMN